MLSKFDAETGCYLPLSKEEIIEFVLQNQNLTDFFNDPEKCNQIQMNPEDQEMTSFIRKYGTNCYNVMPFGLKMQERHINT